MRAAVSEARIRLAVRRMARQIDSACRRHGAAELTVVCVMDGAFIFAADLVRAMRTPTRVVFSKASSYRGTRKGRTRVAGLPETLRGRPVLVVDTIYDTGRTISQIVRRLRTRAYGVWLAVLIEKSGKSVIPAGDQADLVFTGIRINGDRFLVGYGLDVNGRFRHLPGIRAFDTGPTQRARRHPGCRRD